MILHALGNSRERLGRYTRPVSDALIQQIERQRPRTKEQLNRIWYGYHNQQPQHFDSSRYHGVNLHNVWYRGTVEYRWFEATLHAGKIMPSNRRQGLKRPVGLQPQARFQPDLR